MNDPPAPSPTPPCILFTAFEPSGDEHAAPVIAALRRRAPDLPIFAMGGPRMQAAGAQIIEATTERSVMGAGAVSQAGAHRARLKRLRQWVEQRPVLLHVPTDSPAANWAICRMVKNRWGSRRNPHRGQLGRVVHLVAPQVWAWASWRVRRLRRWSDHVLCLLPFEPDWFARRGVEATFIGHPLFDHAPPPGSLGDDAPAGQPRLTLLPGSRRAEVQRNWPVMLNVVRHLRQQFPDLAVLAAAADDTIGQTLRTTAATGETGIAILPRRMEHAIAWADAVLTVSGTATLHVTRQRKPMAIIYRTNPAAWHAVGRWLMDTSTFALPNLVAGNGPHRDRSRHVVPEFIPHLTGPRRVQPIVDAVTPLLTDTPTRSGQVEALEAVAAAFRNHNAGEEAAAVILNLLQTTRP